MRALGIVILVPKTFNQTHMFSVCHIASRYVKIPYAPYPPPPTSEPSVCGVTCMISLFKSRILSWLSQTDILLWIVWVNTSPFIISVTGSKLWGMFHHYITEWCHVADTFAHRISHHWDTVKREMLVAIIFGGFENTCITIWLRFNLAISLKESGWSPYFFQLVTTNFGEIYYFANFAK